MRRSRAALLLGGGVAIALALAALAFIPWSKHQPGRDSVTAQSLVVTIAPTIEDPRRAILSKAQIDEALAAGTLDRPVRSLLRVDKPLQYGEFVWNDANVSPGPLWIRIDLGEQLISAFRGGNEIGTSVIVYGGDNKETPTGKLHILSRFAKHRSSIYEAEMPYTLQLTNDGVAIHGSNVRWGAATHGCIGVPVEFARRLFDQARVGDEVLIIPPANAAKSTS